MITHRTDNLIKENEKEEKIQKTKTEQIQKERGKTISKRKEKSRKKRNKKTREKKYIFLTILIIFRVDVSPVCQQ